MYKSFFDGVYSVDIKNLRSNLMSRARKFIASLDKEAYLDLFYDVDGLCVMYIDESGTRRTRKFSIRDC